LTDSGLNPEASLNAPMVWTVEIAVTTKEVITSLVTTTIKQVRVQGSAERLRSAFLFKLSFPLEYVSLEYCVVTRHCVTQVLSLGHKLGQM